jgi:hypothetical protein
VFVISIVFSSMIGNVSSTNEGPDGSGNETAANDKRAPFCADHLLTRPWHHEARSTLGQSKLWQSTILNEHATEQSVQDIPIPCDFW